MNLLRDYESFTVKSPDETVAHGFVRRWTVDQSAAVVAWEFEINSGEKMVAGCLRSLFAQCGNQAPPYEIIYGDPPLEKTELQLLANFLKGKCDDLLDGFPSFLRAIGLHSPMKRDHLSSSLHLKSTPSLSATFIAAYYHSSPASSLKRMRPPNINCYYGFRVVTTDVSMRRINQECQYPSPQAWKQSSNSKLDPGDATKITKAIEANLDILSKSTNVVAVMPGFKVQSRQLTADPCMRIFVLMKGRYPLGEGPCPKRLGGYETDVCEGFSLNVSHKIGEPFEEVRLGASIGLKGSSSSGTLGTVLVDKSNPKDHYILTCAHVLKHHDKEKTIVHPSEDDLRDYKQRLSFHINDLKNTILRQFGLSLPLLFRDLELYSRESSDDIGRDCIAACSKELRILRKEVLKLIAPRHEQDDEYRGNVPDLLGEIEQMSKDEECLSANFPVRAWMSCITSLKNRLTEDKKRAKPGTDTHTVIHLILESMTIQETNVRNVSQYSDVVSAWGYPRELATYTAGIFGNVSIRDFGEFFVDAAIAKLGKRFIPTTEYAERGRQEKKQKQKPVSLTDLLSGLEQDEEHFEVFKCGRTTGVRRGILAGPRIFAFDSSSRPTKKRLVSKGMGGYLVHVEDPDDDEFPTCKMNLLGVVTMGVDEDKFFDFGDSGSVVFGNKGEAIGLISQKLFDYPIARDIALLCPMEAVLQGLSKKLFDDESRLQLYTA